MRPLTLAITGLATIGFASLAQAQQTTVFPFDFTNAAGSSLDADFPFSGGITRMQAIYESFDLHIADGAQIQSVGFRQDDGRAITGKSIQLAIYMGSTTFDTATATTNFANNYNGAVPRTLVFGPAIVTLPTFTSTTTQGEIWVPLTTPFTYHDAENLVVEYVVTANNNSNLSFNYYLDKGTFNSPATTFSTGCPGSAGNTAALTASNQSRLGSTMTFSMTRAPASSLVWLNLGFSPIPPIDGALFGAPGCTLSVAPNITVSQNTSTGGSATFNFSVPNDLTFYHATIYGQGLIFDLFANQLGFVMSNGASVQLGVNAPMATIRAAGNPSATTGSVRRSDGVISLFQWQ